MTDAPETVPTTEAPAENATMGPVSSTLAFIGFLILIVVVVWGLLHIVQISNISWGSFFKSSPNIEITLPKNAPANEVATVSWNLTNESSPGTFAFMYQCGKGVSFMSLTGRSKNIPCGSAVVIGTSTTARFIPTTNSGTSTLAVPITVIFTPSNGDTRISASDNLPVIQSSAHAEIETATIAPPPIKKTVVHSTYAPTAPSDIAVRIIAVGYIDPASGALLMNRAPQPGDVVGIEFDIANIGGKSTGTWYFEAHLPTATPYTYTSPAQKSLASGDHIVNTLRFTQLAPGGGLITVIADPGQSVSDANRANNEAAQFVY
jgi:hypothetical protein